MRPQELFCQILDCSGRSRKGYRKVRKGVRKRLFRHMRDLGYERAEDYCAFMLGDPVKRKEFNQLTAVTISRFFRDRMLWERLGNSILPELLQRRGAGLRIWSAGCAGGEEPYSLSILLSELGSQKSERTGIELVATDISPECLARAREGVYGVSSLKEVPGDLLRKHFEEAGPGLFRINETHRRSVLFVEQDFLEDPFPADCAIILARNNMFTYFSEHIIIALLERLREALIGEGYLVIGSHEALPMKQGSFTPVDKHRMFYRAL